MRTGLRNVMRGVFLTAVLAALGTPAHAQKRVPESTIDPGVFRIEEKKFLGNKLDRNIRLQDESGRPLSLGDALAGGLPTVLVLSYYNCDGTCSVVNADLANLLKGAKGWTVGQDFKVLTVSFDHDDTLEKMANFTRTLDLQEDWRAGWRFALPGNGEEARKLADSVGFKYFWSPRDRAFLHPGVFVFLSAEGRVIRYLYSQSTRPLDVELALTDAKGNQIRASEIVNYAVGLCYSYNYAEGRYTVNIPLFVGMGSFIFGIVVFTIAVFVYKRRTKGEAFMKFVKPLAFPALVMALGWNSPALAAYTGPDPAKGWDVLWSHVLIDLLAIGVVFSLAAIYMLVKYRAKSPDDVGNAPKFTKAQALAWALIPAAIFMADDFYLSANGWSLWNVYRRVPENALEVKVVGHQWYWDFDYGNGVVTNELKVPVGRPVVLRMTADDVIHSFFMPAYRVKEDVMPGRVTYLWFLPTKPGTEVATCTEFCGTSHSQMFTTVVAVPPEQFAAWMDERSAQTRLADNQKKE